MKRSKIFYGWWVALASSVIIGYTSGAYHYGFTAFFKPILSEFGWNRAQTALAFSLARVEGGLEGPIAGWFIDRVGPRRIMFFGLTVMAIGFVAMSQVKSYTLFSVPIDALWVFYLVYAGIIPTGWGTCSWQPARTAIVHWFRRQRSRALGVISVSAGIGGSIVPPLIVGLIALYGWRNAFLILAAGIILIGYPMASLVRDKPESYGYHPDGVPPPQPTTVTKSDGEAKVTSAQIVRGSTEVNYTVKEALRSSAFWKIVIGISLIKLGSSAVVVHEMPFLLDKGVSEAIAAGAIGFTFFMSIPGRMVFGWLGDFVEKRYLLALSFLLEGFGVFMLLWADRVELLYIAFGLWGLGEGREPLQSGIRADYFGVKAYASIQGIYILLTAIGTVAGPVFAGYVFDSTGSYNQAFLVFIFCYMLASGILLTAKPPMVKKSGSKPPILSPR